MKLTAKAIENARPRDKIYRMFDGGGLYFEVTPSGGTYWRLKYRYMGKEKRMAFGVYPDVGLAEAREKRYAARKLLEQGVDPNEKKKVEKLERIKDYENNFEALAREWHQNRQHAWQPKHAENILRRLEAHMFPAIGARPIKDITPPELLAAIYPIENEGKHELAHRMLQTCGQIYRYGIATGRATHNITADLRGALRPVRSKNFAHLSEKQLPVFLKELDKYDTDYNGNVLTKLAFKFLILTFVRSGEIRGALWSEINWDKKEWRIPAERMKMKSPHIVPLCRQSLSLLKQIHDITGNSYGAHLFPSQQSPRKVMSENTFLKAIDKMGYKGITTAHGFRATASTILNENGFPPDHIERQLAHCERDQIRAAYNHADFLQDRHVMMQWWGDYLKKIGL